MRNITLTLIMTLSSGCFLAAALPDSIHNNNPKEGEARRRAQQEENNRKAKLWRDEGIAQQKREEEQRKVQKAAWDKEREEARTPKPRSPEELKRQKEVEAEVLANNRKMGICAPHHTDETCMKILSILEELCLDQSNLAEYQADVKDEHKAARETGVLDLERLQSDKEMIAIFRSRIQDGKEALVSERGTPFKQSDCKFEAVPQVSVGGGT